MRKKKFKYKIPQKTFLENKRVNKLQVGDLVLYYTGYCKAKSITTILKVNCKYFEIEENGQGYLLPKLNIIKKLSINTNPEYFL